MMHAKQIETPTARPYAPDYQSYEPDNDYDYIADEDVVLLTDDFECNPKDI